MSESTSLEVSEPSKVRIAVLGSLNVDRSYRTQHLPRAGETVLTQGMKLDAGGKGANQAVAVARTSFRNTSVWLLGCTGSDTDGQWLSEQLARSGVDVSGIKSSTELEREVRPTGSAVIAVDDQGENLILVDQGANALCDASFVKLFKDQLLVCDWFIAQGETPLEGVVEFFTIAKAMGKRRVWNPAPFIAPPPLLLDLLDVVVVNQTEAYQLALHGSQPKTSVTHQPIQSPEDALRISSVLLQKLPQCNELIITLGNQGLVFAQSGCSGVYYRSFDVKAVDTTAAGDTFVGALIAQQSLLNDWPAAIRFAQAAAALSVQRAGAQSSMPTRAEVHQFLSNLNA
jgi:ribokinase